MKMNDPKIQKHDEFRTPNVVFELETWVSEHAARKRERRVNMPVILPIVVVMFLLPFFVFLAFDYAYGGALDIIDNPHLEGFK